MPGNFAIHPGVCFESLSVYLGPKGFAYLWLLFNHDFIWEEINVSLLRAGDGWTGA